MAFLCDKMVECCALISKSIQGYLAVANKFRNLLEVTTCLGDRLCMTREGGTGGGGFTQRAKTAWPCHCYKPLVGVILFALKVNCPRNNPHNLCTSDSSIFRVMNLPWLSKKSHSLSEGRIITLLVITRKLVVIHVRHGGGCPDFE